MKKISQEALDKVRNIMSKETHVPFYEVKEENCEYNHYDKLRYYIESDEDLLFRNSISIDQYIMFNFGIYGPQVRAFGKARESYNEDYDSTEYKGSYMSIKDVQAIAKVLDVLEQDKQSKSNVKERED